MRGMRNGEEKSKLVREDVESRGYTLLNDYINDKTKLSLLCRNGHNRDCTYSDLKKYNCKECVNSEKLRNLINSVKDLGYEFISYPKNAKSVAVAYCSNGHIREAQIHNFLNHKCVECVGKNVKKNIDICISIFESKGFKLLETEYINCKTPMRYICICGEQMETTLDAMLNTDKEGCSKCKGVRNSGELASNWRGGITPENEILRRNAEYREWRKSVFERDEYTCQYCRNVGGNLRGHHILNWSSNTSIRYDVNNGITLCSICHDLGNQNSFHTLYGVKNNTVEQLEEFLGSLIFKKIEEETINDKFL